MNKYLPMQTGWIRIVSVTIMLPLAVLLSFLESAAKPAAPGANYQQVKVSGTVTDESGTPLPGVGVRLKGENTGTATDENGKYAINLPDGTVTLVFSYIGYTPQEIAVGNRSTVNVRLEATETSLNAVVVVGYGTQKRETMTTAIASVKSENFVKGAVHDAAQLIRGKVAGLNVITPDANPTGRLKSTFVESLLLLPEPLRWS